jgi:hypothetical protein
MKGCLGGMKNISTSLVETMDSMKNISTSLLKIIKNSLPFFVLFLTMDSMKNISTSLLKIIKNSLPFFVLLLSSFRGIVLVLFILFISCSEKDGFSI